MHRFYIWRSFWEPERTRVFKINEEKKEVVVIDVLHSRISVIRLSTFMQNIDTKNAQTFINVCYSRNRNGETMHRYLRPTTERIFKIYYDKVVAYHESL